MYTYTWLCIYRFHIIRWGLPFLIYYTHFTYSLVAAPQSSTITITISLGDDVILLCVTNITSPTNYTWEQISTQLIISHDTSNNIFSNGSLLLTNVQNSETYKCTAIGDSEQGITIQFVKLVIHKLVLLFCYYI